MAARSRGRSLGRRDVPGRSAAENPTCYPDPKMKTDTTPEAAHAQTLAHRRIGGARRLEIACQMSAFVRALAYERIREKMQDSTDQDVRHQLILELYGIRIGPK